MVLIMTIDAYEEAVTRAIEDHDITRSDSQGIVEAAPITLARGYLLNIPPVDCAAIILYGDIT
jgi:hypothetical protein